MITGYISMYINFVGFLNCNVAIMSASFDSNVDIVSARGLDLLQIRDPENGKFTKLLNHRYPSKVKWLHYLP